MTHNRSSEELVMRGHIEAWGRARWPDARVFHELVVSDCRIDIVFIRPKDLIGVEIKSSRDVLTRLEKQARVFDRHIPEFWVAIAPKWKDSPDKPYFRNEMVVGEAGIERASHTGYRNGLVYCEMLELIWADEARSIAGRKGCLSSKNQTRTSLLPELALRLTGAEILEEVCRELRGRATRFNADAPIRDASHRFTPAPNLFGKPLSDPHADQLARDVVRDMGRGV